MKSILCLWVKAGLFFSFFISSNFVFGQDQNLEEKLRSRINSSPLFKPLSAPSGVRNTHLETLGKKLFFDPNLSGNRNISCATCHHPKFFTMDELPQGIGEGGRGMGRHRKSLQAVVLARNSPPLFNVGHEDFFIHFWDGRIRFFESSQSLITPVNRLNGNIDQNLGDPEITLFTSQLTSAAAAQALFPFINPDEMLGQKGSNPLADLEDPILIWAALFDRIITKSSYEKLFSKAFPNTAKEDLNFSYAAQAIAEFEKWNFRAEDTPWDAYLKGDPEALTHKEIRGALLFTGKAQCSFCHNGSMLSDFSFHGVAYPQTGPGFKKSADDLGAAEFFNPENKPPFGNAHFKYKFKTAPLRNIAFTAPYGHSGSFKNLEQVVRHYMDPEKSLAAFTPGDKANEERLLQLDDSFREPISLTDEEVSDLVFFLEKSFSDLSYKKEFPEFFKPKNSEHLLWRQ